jgi:hypothetical protein
MSARGPWDDLPLLSVWGAATNNATPQAMAIRPPLMPCS